MTKKLVSWDDVANALPAVVQASLDSKYAPAGSGGGGTATTSASDLTSGTLAPARIADGSLAPAKVTGTAVIDSDSRLSDARASLPRLQATNGTWPTLNQRAPGSPSQDWLSTDPADPFPPINATHAIEGDLLYVVEL